MFPNSNSASISELPLIDICRRARNSALLPLLRKMAWCIAGIVLTACQPDSPSGITEYQDASQQESPIDTDSPVEELASDSLHPPPQADLNITSEPGFLKLTWSAIANQRLASIYKFDKAEGFDVLIAQSTDTQQQSLTLPSRTHQRAWQSEQFHVELCDANNCVSSPRVSIAGLAEASVQRIYPAVFIQGERYADTVALNNTATLMAVSLPVQGAIDLYIRSENLWTHSQRILLASDALSSTRSITLALSHSGDTLCALVVDGNSTSELKIIERFGEAWFETTSLDVETQAGPIATMQDANVSNTLSISGNSELILVSSNNRLFTTSRSTTGWTALSVLQQEQYQSSPVAFTERFHTQAVLKSVSANQAHTRLFTVHSFDQSLWLSVWQQTAASSDTAIWSKISAHALTALRSDKEASVRSSASGDRVVLAGWELNNDEKNTAVLWHYQAPMVTSLNTSHDKQLSVIDSLRFPIAAQDSARLRFSADDSLEQLALGWQNPHTAPNKPDAALINYRYSAPAMRWLPKLELPEVFPTVAKQSFVRSTLLSPDGDTMTISMGAGQSLTNENRVGELIILR